jgi:serine protease AprX
MKKITTTLFFLSLIKILFAQNGLAKIEDVLFEKAQHQKEVEALVILHDQADVSFAQTLLTKEQKGEYVFTTLKNHAEQKQQRLLDFLQKENIDFRNFHIVNALYVKTSVENLRIIAEMPEIAMIADNPYVHFDEPKSVPLTNASGERAIEWGIQKIKADSVWLQGNKGQGVVIGGQDTGYQWDHPTLKRAYRGTIDSTKVDHSYNWHDAIHGKSPLSADSLNPCGFNTAAPCADHPHGTHTMGTMVGDDGVGNQIGVAPLARWIACRNMERGNGSPTTYIESFEWFLAPTDKNNKNPNPKKAPHVINNSWYCSTEEGCTTKSVSALMELAVKNLKASGVVVVISAGNDGPNCGTVSEAASSFEAGFTVGATDIEDNIAGFSARGPKVFGTWKTAYIKPNVSAPGVNIRSSVPGNGFGAGWNGTSMAGPHVAGTVALVIAANPKLAGQVEVIEDIIETTAVKRTTVDTCGGLKKDAVPNFTFGFGRIDAYAAVKKAKKYLNNAKEMNEDLVFSFYPNPTTDFFNIQLKNTAEQITVSIYDNHGKKIKTHFEKNTLFVQINVVDFPIGAYFYEIYDGKKIATGKFLKF